MAPRLILALVLALGQLLPTGGVAAWQGGSAVASTVATLTVLAGDVRRVPAGGAAEPVTDGLDLSLGDRVLTGPGARALVTFLDGTTLTVEPDSDVEVRAAEVRDDGASIAIWINLGTVWGRVSGLFDRGSTVSLESNSATAVVNDGFPGAQQAADGSFTCWTRGGEMAVLGSDGQPLLALLPDQATTVQADLPPGPRAFAVNQSALRISVVGSVLPLLLMPDRTRVAGFVAPGIGVNQVFGSYVGVVDEAHVLDVPAGSPGPFTLVLEGQDDGPFEMAVVGLFQGGEVYRHTLSGTLRPGERLATEIGQQLDPATAGDPRTAKLQAGAVAPLQPWDGPLPGKIVLSPLELAAVGGAGAEGGSPASGP